MAGPTASILLESTPTNIMWKELHQTIQAISDKVEGDDFWVVSTASINGTITTEYGRAFGIEKYEIGSDFCHYGEDEILIIKEYVGFLPKYDIGIYAMSNSKMDHKILGELLLYLAEQLKGVINFGGKLNLNKSDIKGDIWEIPYQASSDMTAVYHVSDVEFMKNWLKNNDFKMVK